MFLKRISEIRLDLSKNVNLTSLSLSHYGNELDLSKNVNLTSLSLSHYGNELDLSKNVNLEKLEFCDCENYTSDALPPINENSPLAKERKAKEEREERERQEQQEREKAAAREILKDEIQNLQGEIQSLKEENEKYLKIANETKKKIDNFKLVQSPDRVDLETLKIKHSKLESEASNDKELITTLKNKNDDYKLAIIQLKEDRKEQAENEKKLFENLELSKGLVNQKEVENNSKKNIISKLEKEGESRKTQIQAKEKQLKAKEQELDQLTSEISKFKKEIQGKDYAINNLQTSNQQLTNQNQQLETEKNQLQTQLTQKEQEAEKQKRQKRLGNLFAVGAFATDYLPIPKK